MRASFNTTAEAFLINNDGTIGAPIGLPFPARFVLAKRIEDLVLDGLGHWAYLTCQQLFKIPALTIPAGTAQIYADYVKCAAIEVASLPGFTFLAFNGQAVTPTGATPYYRWILNPYPF